MKKIIIASIIVILIPISLISFAQSAIPEKKIFSRELKIGDSDLEVKYLQSILKSDPEIYPEGLISGYYGSRTEAAVRRLQARYSLPVTGQLNKATQEIIFPSETKIELTIITPNGGEIWTKGHSQTISWKSAFSPVLPQPLVSGRTDAITQVYQPAIQPFFPFANLELIRDSQPAFRQQIAAVNLYDTKYQWRLPQWLEPGVDYRIRISFGRNVVCAYLQEKDRGLTCPPAFAWAEDTSDRPFTISDVGNDPDIINKLKEQIRQMETIISQLQQQLQTIKSLLERL